MVQTAAILFALALIGPLCVWWQGSLEMSFMNVKLINGICIGLTYLFVTYAWINRASKRSKEELFIAVTFSVAAAFLLASVNNCSVKPSFDFLCIQNAAVNILAGKLPYGEETGYVLYPPLYAEATAGLYNFLVSIAQELRWSTQPKAIFNIIFYLFQNFQSLAVVGLLYLTNRFAIDICKMQKSAGALLACALVAFSYPVYGTLQWNQVNIFLTCFVLFVLVYPHRMDALRGLALALGIHLKAYPALLLPPLLLARQWKVCAWSAAWCAVLYAVTLLDFGSTIWTTYFATAKSFIAHITSSPPSYMVNGSNLYSTVYVFAHFFENFGLRRISPETVFSVASVMRLVLGAWFAWRMLSRHLFNKETGQSVPVSRHINFYDDCSDLLSFGLLAGPTTLNHHYVLAIPIMLWTLARNNLRSPFQTLSGCLLITNFQSTITKMMFMTPFGLVLLALARSPQPINKLSKNPGVTSSFLLAPSETSASKQEPVASFK